MRDNCKLSGELLTLYRLPPEGFDFDDINCTLPENKPTLNYGVLKIKDRNTFWGVHDWECLGEGGIWVFMVRRVPAEERSRPHRQALRPDSSRLGWWLRQARARWWPRAWLARLEAGNSRAQRQGRGHHSVFSLGLLKQKQLKNSLWKITTKVTPTVGLFRN